MEYELVFIDDKGEETIVTRCESHECFVGVIIDNDRLMVSLSVGDSLIYREVPDRRHYY